MRTIAFWLFLLRRKSGARASSAFERVGRSPLPAGMGTETSESAFASERTRKGKKQPKGVSFVFAEEAREARFLQKFFVEEENKNGRKSFLPFVFH